jgi:VanZ family protein
LKNLNKFFIYWFPIILYCLLIFIQSSYPSIKSGPELPHIDKVLHFVAYAFLGALFLRAFKTSRIKNNVKLILILSIFLSSLYGVSDEIHQYFVPYRSADLMDILADMLGGLTGGYLYRAIFCKSSMG